MKKLIIVLAVGIIAADSMAQTGQKAIPPPPPPQAKGMHKPPPPPPEEVKFTPPKNVKDAPPPPRPPKPPVKINEKGYAILVQPAKDEPVILLTKKGITQKIRMSVWNAKPEYFENKYGKLPPPPPPMPEGGVKFTPPKIVKDAPPPPRPPKQ
ncbi:hypothetical protein [Ferruginibacter sp. SUN106]|uniref:hypothetical protein n=1 Tax=Ferruginibacter sp. SUN106 TaxID=2978348 RepID=UPI003D3641EA